MCPHPRCAACRGSIAPSRRSACCAADGGLAVIERIIAGARRHLTPGRDPGRRGRRLGGAPAAPLSRPAIHLARIRTRRRRRVPAPRIRSAGLNRMSGQHDRPLLLRHDVRREPRTRARRDRGRLSAGARTVGAGSAGGSRTAPYRDFAAHQPAPGARPVRILSGVFEGRTTGTAIGLCIDNVDARSRDYEKIKDRFRPGHADYAYQQKYGIRDYRGGGRSSARITVATVAAGAIARKYLREKSGIEVDGLPVASRAAPARLRGRGLGSRQSVLLRRSGQAAAARGISPAAATRRGLGRARASRYPPAACRQDSASRCSTGSMRTSHSP